MRRLILFLILFSLLLAGTAIYLREERKSSTKQLTLYGNVDVRQVDLGFRLSARVDEMPFQEGDYVQKGTFMARLDQQPFLDRVREAQASRDAVATSLANAEKILKRREELVAKGGVSKEDYDNAISSHRVYQANLAQAEAALGVTLTDLKDTEIFAPNDGTILTRIREPGAVVKPADAVYTLSLISPVWVRAFVSEPQLGLIYPGMPAEIHTDTPGSKVYTGHVGFISPVAEFTPKSVETTQLRTDLVYRLRIIADNPDQFLKQGMPVTVVLPLHHQDREAPR